MQLVKLNSVTRQGMEIAPIQKTTKSGTTTRLVSKKEFKEQFAGNLKGNALSVAYNAYLRAGGANAIGELVKRVANGELMPTSERDSKSALTVRFAKVERLTVDATMVAELDVTEQEKMLLALNAAKKLREDEAAKAAAEAAKQLEQSKN